MNSNTPLDYAVLQLSPRRTRCELFISSRGDNEKVASGLVRPFVSHLKIAEELVTQEAQTIRLAVERRKNAENWFTKGTVERFVQFVNTPEILEIVNTFDFEMSQLEAAQKIYSQGTGDQNPGVLDKVGTGIPAGGDATKKELLRAIDVRFAAVKQDLTMACARASSAGFNPDTVADLQLFSEHFGTNRLSDACTKFISVCQRRLELSNQWKPSVDDELVRSSWGSDMSIEDLSEDTGGSHNIKLHRPPPPNKQEQQQTGQEWQPDLTQSHILNLSKSATSQPLNSFFSSKQQFVKNEDKEVKKNEEVANESPSQQNPPARRLSVQDRINMFENKQKENSGGKPVIVGKSAELRRLSSDISSASASEKAVLRRWSGASDMSIDLGNDKKENDNTDSPLCTPSSSMTLSKSNAFPGVVEDVGDQKELNSSAGSVKVEHTSASSFRDQGESQMPSGGSLEKNEGKVSKVKGNWKDQTESQTLKRFPLSRGEPHGMSNLRISEVKLKVTSVGEGKFESKDQVDVDVKSRGFMKNQRGVQMRIGTNVDNLEDVARDQPLNQSRFRSSHVRTQSFSGQVEGNVGGKVKEVLHKEAEIVQSAFDLQGRSFSGELGQGAKMDIPSFEKERTKIEDLDVPKMKVQKALASVSENLRRIPSKRDEGSIVGSNKPVGPSMKNSENQESFGTIQAPPLEQVNRVRQSKGNQELNDELKMKANELEKLFAEHKLRIPGEQSSSTRRNKPTEMQAEQAVSLVSRKPAAELSPLQFQDKKTIHEPTRSNTNAATFSTPPAMKMIDDQDAGSSLRQSLSEIGMSEDYRGRFYEKYTEKRDAKLREEWGSKRAEKEAKLKAMQDSFEQSRAEMKATFSRSADRRDSLSTSRHRAEKLKSFNARSNMKREQLPLDFTQSEDDEDISEFSERRYYDQDKSSNEISLGDLASKSLQSKKFLINKNSALSTPRTTAAPIPQSLSKTSIPSSGKQRVQSDNLLSQSVPNFADFRKENTRPTSGVIKPVQPSKGRTYTRSKSSSEEQKEQSLNSKFSKNGEPKSFLRKGSGKGSGLGAKLKASVSSETPKNEEFFEELTFAAEKLVDVVKAKEEEFEESAVEDCNSLENGKPRLSQESDKISISGSENDNSRRSLSQLDPVSVVELPASLPSTFNAIGSLQNSPGESPVSWNSRIHNQFLYPHETFDFDVSVDSSVGSPASLNSHSLAQTDGDAARMRKKWGSAQKPLFSANSSQNISHKDVTKGFKRLLKFGRKSRGTETLVDWVSATTSEGDDDTEDGRDPATRPSDDTRKSRMGYSRGHPSDDGFNDGELFNDQVLRSSIPAPPANFKLTDDSMSGSSIKAPRSFFSLSTFRSKGSESKLR